MKKAGYNLKHVLFIIVYLLVMTALLLHYANFVLQLTLLGGIFLLFMFWLMICPLGKRRLAVSFIPEAALPLGFISWLLRVWGVQFACYFLWLSLGAAILSTHYSLSASLHNTELLLIAVMGSLSFQGLHPWPLVALLIAAMGVIGHVYRQEKSSGALQVWSRHALPPAVYSALDIAAFLGPILLWLLSISLALTSLLAAGVHYFAWQNFSYGQSGALVAVIVLAVLLSQKQIMRQLQRRTAGHKTLVSLMVYLFVFAAALLLGYLLFANSLPDNVQQLLQQSLQRPPKTVQQLRVAWLLLFWCLQTLLIPFLAAWLLRLSVGRSVRAVCAALLLPPLFIALCLQYFASDWQQHAQSIAAITATIHYGLTAPLLYIMPLLAYAGMVYLSAHSAVFNDGLIQITANLAGKNLRRYRRMLLQLSPFIGWVLLIFYLTGLYGLQLILALMALTTFIGCVPCNSIAVLRYSWRPPESSEQRK